MGFTLPLALLGALAVAAPILIHLLRQRDVPTRSLPTVALLRRATAESRRKLRLRDRLLLLLRALAVLAFAIGASGPWLASSRAFDDGRRASIAIVLDDSMSMARRESGERLFATAIARANDQLDALPPDSEVALVLAGAPARLVVPRTRELTRVRRALAALPDTTARGTALSEALELARASLSGAAQPRRVIVFSDFAAHARLTELPPTRGIEWALEPLAPSAPANAAILEAHAAPDPTTPGRLSIEVVLRAPEGRHALEVVHDDVVLGRTEVVVEPGAEAGALVHPARATVHVTPPPVPDATVRLVIEDALDLDDARGVLLRPSAALRALLVDGEPHPSRDRDEVGFLARAIEATPHDDGGIAFRVVDPDAFAPSALEEVDVVVLANVATLRPRDAESLRRFVEAGGGLLVAMGERVEPRVLRGQLPWLPASPRAARALPELTTLRSVGRLPALDARVSRVVVLEPSLGAEVLVETAGADEGAPVLVRSAFGEGRVAVLAVPVDDAWSELPYSPGYLPLVSELLRDLAAARRAPSAVLSAGASIELAPRHLVRAPDGSIHEPVEGRFDDTAAPGVYRVLDGDEVKSSFVVASPASESDLTPGSPPEATAGDDTNGARSERRRRPIDPWFFLLGGLCLLGEGWLRAR
ncbi:MAG: VWA domain-containing protein [Myxococcota bacterium]|nr:VWA domain-containing protein [Myxococcota bacterium]